MHHAGLCKVEIFVKYITRCLRTLTHPGGPAIAFREIQWQNTKSGSLVVWSAGPPSSSRSRHTRCGLIEHKSDSYQPRRVPVLSVTDLTLGHNLQYILVSVAGAVGHNKMPMSHSRTWQSIQALAVGSPPEYTWPIQRVLCAHASLHSSTSYAPSHLNSCILSITSLLLICKGYGLEGGQRWGRRASEVEKTAVFHLPPLAPITLMTDTDSSEAPRPSFRLLHFFRLGK